MCKTGGHIWGGGTPHDSQPNHTQPNRIYNGSRRAVERIERAGACTVLEYSTTHLSTVRGQAPGLRGHRCCVLNPVRLSPTTVGTVHRPRTTADLFVSLPSVFPLALTLTAHRE